MGFEVLSMYAKLGLDSSDYDRGLDNAKGKASGIGSALGTAAKVGAAAIAAATTATVAFGKSAVDAGMSFDATMSKVAAISGKVDEADLQPIIDQAKQMGLSFEEGADATETAMNILREQAQRMGATTKFSASESGEALTYMAMAGWKADDMLGGLEGIMNLAAASGEDLATTSDIVTDALTAFGLAAEDSNRFADVLAAASSNANTNVALMGETFKYVAPVAGSLGYSIEDTATAIGLMANAGVKGSMAGTALRSMLTRMAKPTKESQAAMDALGVSLEDGKGNMLSLGEVMKQLRNGFSEGLMMAPEEFADALAQLDAALESGELSSTDYDKSLEMLMERAYGAEGAVKAEYAAMLGGQQAMSGLLAIVNATDEDFDKLTSAIYGSEGAAQQMADTMQDNLLGDLTIFKSALEGAKIAVSDELTPSLRELVQFGSDGISKLTLAFKEDGVNGAMEAFGSILSEGLAMLTAGLPDVISAGIELLQALMQGISDNVDQLSGTAVTVAVQLVTFLLDNLPLIIQTGLDILIALANGIAENLPTLIPTIVDVILQIVDTLTDPETLSNLIDAAIAIMIALTNGIIDALPRLAERVPEIVENIVDTLIENLPKLLKASVRIIGQLAKGLIENLPLLFQAAGKIVAEIVGGIGEVIHDLWEAGKDIIDEIWNGINSLDPLEWGRDLISNFVSGITEKWDRIKGGVTGIAQTIKDLLGFSEPKEGPLSDFHTYAPDMMALFAKGIRDNEHLITDQLEDSFDFGNSFIKGSVRTASAHVGGYDSFDLADAIRYALSGVGVYMDGQQVGALVTNYQRSNARAYGR